ncbi:hypothetical protein C8Q70DRAFT_923012 [Cubamyces menziesii]|nr:hypothetical protein C8Q70DRAFT_923012 [Cubamyces menziesii]
MYRALHTGKSAHQQYGAERRPKGDVPEGLDESAQADETDGEPTSTGTETVSEPLSVTPENAGVTSAESTDEGSLLTTASELGMILPEAIRGHYLADSFFRHIFEDPGAFPQFTVKDGLVYKDDEGVLKLCIPDILVGSRRLREIVLRHAHSVLAHLGHRKTLTYLREEVWWCHKLGHFPDLSGAYLQGISIISTYLVPI